MESLNEGCQWNLGICATGAGEGEVALQVWKDLGQKIEMGRFGLPDGGYPQCKIRLAERPLAERDASQDDPGLEETIWVERLSPCHGIIRSVLYQDLGIDYGDVVLFDGAPITYHTYGEERGAGLSSPGDTPAPELSKLPLRGYSGRGWPVGRHQPRPFRRRHRLFPHGKLPNSMRQLLARSRTWITSATNPWRPMSSPAALPPRRK